MHIMQNGSYGDYTHQLFDADFMNWTEQEILFCSSKRSFLLAALSMDVGTEFMLTPKFSWWLFLCFINQLWSMLYFKCPPHCWGWQKFCDLMYLQAGTNTTKICFNNSNCDSWLVPPGEGTSTLACAEPFEDASFIPNHDTITRYKFNIIADAALSCLQISCFVLPSVMNKILRYLMYSLPNRYNSASNHPSASWSSHVYRANRTISSANSNTTLQSYMDPVVSSSSP